MSELRPVRVRWVDSMGGGDDWKSQSEIDDLAKSGVCQITSVGLEYHPVSRKEPWLMIGMDQNVEQLTGRVRATICKATMSIPKVAILSLEYLEPTKPKRVRKPTRRQRRKK